MMRCIVLGRLFGIPIHLDTSWFVILGLVTWTLATRYFPFQVRGLSVPMSWLMGGLAAVLLFVCVLLHELGHSLIAKREGIPVNRVTLFLFGGVAQIASSPTRPLVELKVALAGPLVSIAIAALCAWGSSRIPLETTPHIIAFVIARYLAVVNLAILVFNMLPGFPLDGGRVLRAALWAWSGDFLKATRVTSTLGSALGFGLLGLGLWAVFRGQWIGGIWYACLGFFLRDAALVSSREVLMRR